MDGKFECLRKDITGVQLNTNAADEHIPYIERQIRFIKERFRSIRSTLPFKMIPNQMIIELLNFCVLCLNAFPPSRGFSSIYNPRIIMTETALDYNKHCELPFGACIETYEEDLRKKAWRNEHGTQSASVLLITSKAATNPCASAQDVVSQEKN
jgi:hypothetical protein